jgi:hypothetical protein
MSRKKLMISEYLSLLNTMVYEEGKGRTLFIAQRDGEMSLVLQAMLSN